MTGIYLFVKNRIISPLVRISRIDTVVEPLPYRMFELRLAKFLRNPTSERIIEHPWTIKWLERESNGKILDIGCGDEALLTTYLISKGYDAYGIDLLDTNRLSKDRFYKRDVTKTGIESETFGTILLVSTLEHIGSKDEDFETMEESYRLLKKDGLILLSSPFCKDYEWRGQRFFSRERIYQLSKKFVIIEESYHIQKGAKWYKVGYKDAEEHTKDYKGPHSIAIMSVVLKKK